MIRERTRAGLAAARERGNVPGRKAKLSAPQQAEVIRQVQAGEKTAAEAARLFGVHRSSISRLLARAGLDDLTPQDRRAPRDGRAVRCLADDKPFT
jgi:DNA invertase Pin-like site-specific DNA recombinase